MTINEAMQKARIELGKLISLSPVELKDIPSAVYDPGGLVDSYIFNYSFEGDHRVGASNYIAISKTTGEVVSLPQSGE